MTPSRQALIKKKIFLVIVGLALFADVQLHATLRLSGVFNNHMVLQRDMPVPVWGWADAGEKVTVRFEGQKKTAVADMDGKWRVTLDAMPANASGQPLIVTSHKGKESIRRNDVLVGDVWLCSGQSNMGFAMARLKGTIYSNDLATASFPLIRQGLVAQRPSLIPTNNTVVSWLVCSPKTVGHFTAAGYYFARDLQRKLHVPIGLLLSAWGGTSAESWTSRRALDTVSQFKARAAAQTANLRRLPEEIKTFPARLAAWEQANGRVDTANLGQKRGWQKASTGMEGWHQGLIHSMWSDLGLTNGGIAWLRKEVEVRPFVHGQSYRVDLSFVMDQYVSAYWNGVKIGSSGTQPPKFYDWYVNFYVPPKLLHPGKNLLALRYVVDVPNESPMGRVPQTGFPELGFHRMSGNCLIRVEREFPPLTQAELAARPAPPKGDMAHTSSALFGGMINPLIPFAFKGCLWYQGEQDAGRAVAYRTLLPLMIRDWWSRWGRQFPFIIQQLPNFDANGANRTSWAQLREAQAMTAQRLTNCWLSVAIDVGEADNVHPKNKRAIGRRLMLVALANVYHHPVAWCGPVYKSMQAKGSKVWLKFKHAHGLKSLDGQPLRDFTIAGPNRTFVPARAQIEGDQVVVSNPQVAKPVAVRYAFINNPTHCNFSNVSGLPAMPFRTDDWPTR